MTVTFCGSSVVAQSDAVAAALYEITEKLIRQGATKFLLGGYGDFDLLAAKTVKELKEKYPDIASIIILPYLNRNYNKSLYDHSEYPGLERVPQRLAIIKRNEYMVSRADVVVSYVKYTFGGSAKTLEYAKQKKKRIIDLATNSALR